MTELGSGAFEECEALESINIPSGIEYIEEYTFSGCTSLKEIDFNEGLKHILYNSFFGCTALTSIALPDSIESVTGFMDCTALSEINFPDKYFKCDSLSFRGTAYSNDLSNYENGQLYIGKNLICDKDSVDCVVKEGTVRIAGGCFNSDVRSLHIPASVEYIDEYIYGEITVDENNQSFCVVDNILYSKDMKTLYSYYYYSPEKSFTVPKGVETIGANAFKAPALEEVIMQDGVKYIYTNAFGYYSIKCVTIPDSVIYIEDGFSRNDSGNIKEAYTFYVNPFSYAHEYLLEGRADNIYFINGDYTPMSDIDTKSWHADSVKYCVSRNFMIGTGSDSFSPRMNMTREQFVTLLARVKGADLTKYGGATGYKDAPAGKWYSAAVKWASEEGVVYGIGEGKFGIGNKMTREQALTVLYRIYEGEKDIKENSNYTDYKNVSDWALDAVNWGINNKIITSTVKGELRISPQMYLTRAQTAAIIMHFHCDKENWGQIWHP